MTNQEIFEAWAYGKKWNIFKRDGVYADDFVDAAWHGWQASTQREGYKFVPVVDNDAMWCAGRDVIAEDGYATDSSDVYKAMIGAVDERNN